MAKEYGQLPSYIRDHATTYDIMVMDIMSTWEQQRYNAANGIKEVPKLSQQQMLDMLKTARDL